MKLKDKEGYSGIEARIENPRVGGSIPPQATKTKAKCSKHLAPQKPADERAFLRV
ncbi:hypothetical protein [Inhella inkyongensis]|uniref:hypothetical protein n=1 Tax=Inhella inkyongensis TaxID=392593 RepID=UPI0015864FD0|nr:hypothetical protein [Inhella inkyongensis]